LNRRSRAVSRALYSGRLRKMLGRSRIRDLLIMIWSANSLREGRGAQVGGRLSFPNDAVAAEPGSEKFIAPWTLETLVNEALVSSTQRNDRQKIIDTRSWATFTAFYNLINAIEDAESLDDIKEGEIIDALPRIAWRQFSWQRGFVASDRFYRAWYLYNFAEANEHMILSHGISVERFCYVGFAIASQLINFPAVRLDTTVSTVGIKDEERDAFFALASVPLAKARKLAALIRGQSGQIAYKPSLLRTYPLLTINSGDQLEAFCPLPPLLHLRYTDGLFYDLVSNDNVRRIVSQRFEAYVCDITGHYFNTNFQVLGETEYGPPARRRATPDIRLIDNDEKVHAIVECKARRLPFRVLAAAKPIETNPDAFSDIIKGVIQIWRYASDLRRKVTGESFHLSNRATGVVLTLDPWVEMYPNVIAQIIQEARKSCTGVPEIETCDQIPISFITIDDWEYCLRNIDAPGFLGSLEAHARPERAGYMLSFSVAELDYVSDAVEPFDYRSKLSNLVPWWGDLSAQRIPK